MAFSANGRVLATGGVDGLLHLWDAATGKRLRELGRHAGSIDSLTLSGDGKAAASYCLEESRVRVWDTATGIELRSFEFEPPQVTMNNWRRPRGLSLGLACRGKILAVRDSSTRVRLWEVSTGREWGALESEGAVVDFACSPDGRTLAASVLAWEDVQEHGGQGPAGKGWVHLWDLSGEQPRLRKSLKGGGHLFFFPDGKFLGAHARGKPWGRRDKVRLWELTTGKLAFDVTLARECQFVQGALRGQVLAVESGRWLEGSVAVWDLLVGKQLGRFAPPGEEFDAVALSADGRTLATAPSDTTVLTWDLPDRVGAPRRLGGAELGRLWADLAGEDAARAYRAVRALSESAISAVPFLKARLPPAAAKDHGLLIADLGASKFALREKAAKRLQRQVHDAEPALRAVMKKGPPLEVRRRIEKILAALADAPPAELLRAIRAVQALEYAGTPESLALLRELAAGAPEARLTREARGAVQRLPQGVAKK
jgi:WD40 repeat protein